MIREKNILGRVLSILFVALFSAVLFGTAAFADGKAKVTVNSAYIRANASTSGTVVGGANKGDVLDVISSETDSAGYTWYKVKVSDSVTGYIRSDLVSTEGVSSSNSTTTTSTTPSPSVTVEQTIPTEAEPVGGSVTGDVRVRAGASTSHSVVTTAKQNTAVTVIGFATASDGNVWYQITYNNGTSDINGYIRSDYVKLDGDLKEKTQEPEPEPEPEVTVPEPEPEPEVYKDYEAVYDADSDTWYLNNYIEGNKSSIPELLEAKSNLEKKEAEFAKTIKKKNFAVGFLVVIIVALLGLGVYAYISVRRWYYGADDESEEPAHSYTRTERRDTTPTQTRSTASSGVRVQTVGATKPVQPAAPSATATSSASSTVKQTVLKGERLPDGSIRMPDGSIRKTRVAVKLADGSLKFEDGTIQKPDGTRIKPGEGTESAMTSHQGTSTQESRQIQYSHTSEANSDDDMEYGFLNLDDRMSE